MAKIYVASSWRNDLQQALVHLLRDHGHEVYDFKNPSPENKGFGFHKIDPDWNKWTIKHFIDGLNHPLAIEGFALDFTAMQWADICVLLLPCGRSAHTEAGWFLGRGKKVYAILNDDFEPELMYKLFEKIFDSPADLIHFMDQQPENKFSHSPEY